MAKAIFLPGVIISFGCPWDLIDKSNAPPINDNNECP